MEGESETQNERAINNIIILAAVYIYIYIRIIPSCLLVIFLSTYVRILTFI